MKYTHQAIINKSNLLEYGITEERIIKEQIIKLIQDIPLEDLTKIFEVTIETLPTWYFSDIPHCEEQKITVVLDTSSKN